MELYLVTITFILFICVIKKMNQQFDLQFVSIKYEDEVEDETGTIENVQYDVKILNNERAVYEINGAHHERSGVSIRKFCVMNGRGTIQCSNTQVLKHPTFFKKYFVLTKLYLGDLIDKTEIQEFLLAPGKQIGLSHITVCFDDQEEFTVIYPKMFRRPIQRPKHILKKFAMVMAVDYNLIDKTGTTRNFLTQKWVVDRYVDLMKEEIVISVVNAREILFWMSDIIDDNGNNTNNISNTYSNNNTKIDTRCSGHVFDMNGTSNNGCSLPSTLTSIEPVVDKSRITDSDNNETQSKVNYEYFHGQRVVNGNTQEKTEAKIF